MKQIVFILTLMATALFCSAQGQVNFFEGTWEEAFAKAAEEDKHVFVDSYTDWCYWCKVMDKETFTDKAIADYLNEEFVAIKVDMEKGFGTSVAMKFRVRAFPTLLFFNPQGQIIEKKPGFEKDNAKFLEHLKGIRADKRPQVYAFASQNFDLDYPAFLEGVFGVGGKRARTNAETVDAWLDETDDLYNEVAWTALTQCPTGEKYKQHMLDNSEKYIGLYGAQEFDGFVSNVVYSKVSAAGKEGDKQMLDEAIGILNKYYTNEEDKADMVSSFEMSYMKATEDWEGYTMKADKLIREGALEENLGLANSVAWTLYEKCDDPKCLKMMEEWMNKVVELEPNYMFLDTYAALLYKNGDMPKAKKYAEQAIVVGKKDESDIGETEALLKKIEASMEDGQ